MIGYYVHHHGAGHLHRARCLAAALADDVVALSTLAPRAGFADWVQLPPDDAEASRGDVTAHGALHHAPIGAPLAARRTAVLTDWVATHRPRAVVVDVSVEAALAVRLTGAPVVVVAQPGDRDDAVHRLGYTLADLVVVPWAAAVYSPAWLRPHAPRTRFVGAISRFDDRRPSRATADGPVVALQGSGGSWDVDLPAGVVTPSAGDDVWTLLQSASVVLTHGGLNAIAEVAAARRPAFVLPQSRPFDEQHATATALAAAGVAVTGAPPTGRWSADGWERALRAARGVDPHRWADWSFGDGAARAAAAVETVAVRW